MRREIVVLGSFMIVLILIAGCSSAQNGTANGAKSQNPAISTKVETNSVDSLTSIIKCNKPPLDPIQFQKFFPDVPGFERPPSQKRNYANFSQYANTGIFVNSIGELYTPTGNPRISEISAGTYYAGVSFLDYGPCSDYFLLKGSYLNPGQKNATQTNINFHGYPALKIIKKQEGEFQHNGVTVIIGVSNRLFVKIDVTDFSNKFSISEEEADIEKFANAIDFKGFAAST